MSLQDWTASAPITTHYEITVGDYTAIIEYLPLDEGDEHPWIWYVVDMDFGDFDPCATPEEAAIQAESEIADAIAWNEANS